MITEAAADQKLDRATELSRTSLSSIHSSEGAWQQAHLGLERGRAKRLTLPLAQDGSAAGKACQEGLASAVIAAGGSFRSIFAGIPGIWVQPL